MSPFRKKLSEKKSNRLNKILTKAEDSLKDTDDASAMAALIEISPVLKKGEVEVSSLNLRRYLNMMSRFDMDDARSVFMEGVRRGQADDSTILFWSKILIDKGSKDEAREILSSLGVGPFEHQRHYLLGLSWMESTDLQRAINSLKESMRWDHLQEGPYHLLEQIDPHGNWGLIHLIEAFDFIDKESSRDIFPEDFMGKGPIVRLAKALYLWHTESREAAVTAWKSVRSRNADNLMVVKVGARLAFHLGKSELCFERYDEAVHLDPTNVGLLQEYGDAAIELGNPLKSLTIFDNSLSLCPMGRKAMMSKIRAFSLLDDSEGCAELARLFSQTAHWDKHSQHLVIESLIACGAHAEAYTMLSVLIDENPDDLPLLRLMIRNQTLAKDYEEAVKVADKVAKNSDEGFDDVLVKANIQFMKQDFKGVRRTLSNILRLEPSNLPALLLLKNVSQKEGDEVAVLELSDQILHLDPDNISAMMDKASSLDKTGAGIEAMEMYMKILRSEGEGPSRFNDILNSLMSNDRFAEAATLSDNFQDLHGGAWESWMMKGNSYYGAGRMDEAAQAYSKATTLNGKDSVLWFSKGIALEMAGQLQDSLDSYDKSIIQDLTNAEAWMGRAVVLEKMGDPRESLKNLNQLLNLNPGHRFAHIFKSRLLVRMKKYEEAIYFLDMAIRLDHRDLMAMTLKKEILIHTQDYDGVVLVCNDILRHKNDDRQTMLDKAKALQKIQQHSEALKVFARLLRSKSEDREILELKKASLQSLGRTKETLAVLNDLLSRDQDNKGYLNDLYTLMMKTKDYPKALEALERLINIDPTSNVSYVMKAELLIETEQYEEAIEVLKHIRYNLSWDVHSMALMSKSLLGLKEGFAALEIAEEGLALDSNMGDLHICKVRALLSIGREKEALLAIEEGLSTFPRNCYLWRYRGQSYMMHGDTMAALHAFDRAIGFGDDDPDTYYQRALALRSLEKTNEAISSLEKAIQLNPKHSQAWSLLGVLQTELGLLKEAKKSLDKASIRSPEDRQTLLRKARLHVAADESRKALDVFSQMLSKGMADASLYVEMGDLMLEIEDLEGARKSFHSALDMDPFIIGLKERTLEIEEQIRKQEIGNQAFMIIDMNFRDDQPLEQEYIKAHVDAEYLDEVTELLLGIPDVKKPIIWSPDFENLETISRDVILANAEKELDRIKNISLAKVYMRLPEPNLDFAKSVRAHIQNSLKDDLENCEIISSRVHSVRESISSRESLSTLFEVLKKYELGPYGARLAIEGVKGRIQ